MTFFSFFDVPGESHSETLSDSLRAHACSRPRPVFWPIVLVYWLMLFVLTMKRQIKHMIKHRYLPFTRGKPKPAQKGAAGGKDAK